MTSLATFLYDTDPLHRAAGPYGNRVKGTVNGVTTVYVAGVYEFQNGAYTRYYEGGGMRRSGYASGNGVFYALNDHLKSTSTIVNQAGVVQAQQYYFPFGGNRGGSFSSLTTKRFTSQYHEASLPGGEGLYFYNARWYDAQLGRFTQADTIVPDPGNPQDLNRFSYVRNNPLRYVDPTGHYLFEDQPDDPAFIPPKRSPTRQPQRVTWDSRCFGDCQGQPIRWTRRELSWGPLQSPEDNWVDLGFDWFLQHGPETRRFGEGDYMVESLKHHPGVDAARNAALDARYPPGVPFRYSHDFGPDGYVRAWKELDGTGHFLGTYYVFITDRGDGFATVRVENQSDWASFTNLRSSEEDISLVERLNRGQPLIVDGHIQFKTILRDVPRDETIGFGGNFKQIYEWQEEWP